LDYVETIKQWNKRLKLTLSISVAMIRTARYFLIDRNLRFRLLSLVRGCQYECFEREIMDHKRMVLEKIAGPDAN